MVYVFNLDDMWNSRYLDRNFFCTLKQYLCDPFLLFYGLSWILIRYCRQTGQPIPILNNWLTDFVFVPLIAYIAFCIGNLLLTLYSTPHYYPLYQIFVLAFFVSIVFEYIMPQYTNYNVSDPIDTLCYFAGGCFYYFCHQNYLKNKFS